MRSYIHSQFDGVSLSPNGGELSLAYFDWDQGGTRLCFRYIFGLAAPLRLLTGYAHESGRREKQIIADEIPYHVVADGCTWLEAQLATVRNRPKTHLCAQLTEHFEALKKLRQ